MRGNAIVTCWPPGQSIYIIYLWQGGCMHGSDAGASCEREQAPRQVVADVCQIVLTALSWGIDGSAKGQLLFFQHEAVVCLCVTPQGITRSLWPIGRHVHAGTKICHQHAANTHVCAALELMVILNGPFCGHLRRWQAAWGGLALQIPRALVLMGLFSYRRSAFHAEGHSALASAR